MKEEKSRNRARKDRREVMRNKFEMFSVATESHQISKHPSNKVRPTIGPAYGVYICSLAPVSQQYPRLQRAITASVYLMQYLKIINNRFITIVAAG
jgi:hypothetical protein